MKFKSRYAKDKEAAAKHGEERVIRKFLFFPKSLGEEMRWMEFALIKQVFIYECAVLTRSSIWYWDDVKWADITDLTPREIAKRRKKK